MSDSDTKPVQTADAETATPLDLVVLEEATDENLPVVAGALEVQTPDTISPVRPEHVDDKRNKELVKQAKAIAKEIIANPSDIELNAQVYGLGTTAMESNSEDIELMDTKIGPVMKEIGTESSVGQSLTQIKAQLDLVNPHVVSQTEGQFKGKLLGIIPRIVKRLPKSNEIMAVINERRDTVAGTIDSLRQHLWQERDKALRNALQLGSLANQLAAVQDDLQEAAYQGQLIWVDLSAALEKETDPVKQQALRYLTTDLAMRVIDIQTVDQLNIQSRMGAETLVNNCRGIEQLVSRVSNILLPAVRNALAVKAAAAQQAQLAAHARGITAAAGETIADTAGQIREVSVDIAKQNTDTVIDLEKLEEAAAQYEQMQLEVQQVMDQAEQNARGVSNRVAMLNSRMRKVADPLTQARQAKEAAGV